MKLRPLLCSHSGTLSPKSKVMIPKFGTKATQLLDLEGLWTTGITEVINETGGASLIFWCSLKCLRIVYNLVV